MSHMRVHDEIWEMISTKASMDSIESLSLTCRRLHTLMSSLFVWRAVIRDLLALSPNPFLALSFLAESARSLRTKALRFHHIHRTLCAGSAAQMRSVTFIDFPDRANTDESRPVRLLPGTGCIVYGAEPEDGEDGYCIKSLITNAVVSTSPFPAAARWAPNLEDVFVSKEYGLVVATTMELDKPYMTCGAGVWVLQLLRVDCTNGLQLVPLLCVPLDRQMRRYDWFLSWKDSDLMIIWPGHGGQPTYWDIINVSRAISQHGGAVTLGPSAARNRWTPSVECNRIDHESMPQMLSSRTILVSSFRADAPGTAVFLLHLPSACAPGWTAQAETVKQIGLLEHGAGMGSWDMGRLHAVRNSSPGMAIDVVFREHISVLHLAHDGTFVRLENLTEPTAQEGGYSESAAACGAVWIACVSAPAGSNLQTLRITRRPGVRTAERLDAQAPEQVVLETEHDPRAGWTELEFDEWTGVGIMPWGYDGLVEGATVFVV